MSTVPYIETCKQQIGEATSTLFSIRDSVAKFKTTDATKQGWAEVLRDLDNLKIQVLLLEARLMEEVPGHVGTELDPHRPGGLCPVKPRMVVVKLTEEGVRRVLNGAAGMTFIVDAFTNDRHGKPTVAHVRDYRYAKSPHQIWSLAEGDYEIVKS